MKIVIPRHISIGLFLSVIIVICVAYLVYSSLNRFTDSSNWEAHTYKVLSELEHVLSELKDIETGTRGFIITGKENFLEPYNEASGKLDSSLAYLEKQIYDRNLREIELEELKKLIYEKVEIQEEAIEIRKRYGFQKAESFVSEEFGKNKMDEIRLKISDMMNAENLLLKERIIRREETTKGMYLASGILLLLFITAVCLIFLFLRKEFLARERTQNLLKQSAEYTQMIINTVITPLIVLDKNYNVISASRSFYSRFSYSKGSIEKKTFFNLFNGELDRADLKRRINSILPNDSTIEDYEISLSNGRTLLLNARKLRRIGNHTMMILVGIEDVTDRKDAQRKASEYTSELEKLNDDKDKFFSVIAHDLKSPFTSILGFTEIMAMSADELTREEIKEFSETLFTSSRNIYRLLEDLLQWARLQSGKMQIEPEILNLNSVFQGIINIYKINAATKNIKLVMDADTNLSVKADKNSVNTVLRNLVSNAVKFTPNNGEVVISARKTPNEVLISVKDSGVGMDEKSIAKLFGLGQNFTTNGTKGEKGTGLGLILCKDLIEKNGGRIWAESIPGAGSTFTFSLPYKFSGIMADTLLINS